MNAVVNGQGVFVTLSRRNLKTLLAKLDIDGSARMLYRLCPSGASLVVKAEDDDLHYNGRIPGPVKEDPSL